MPRIMRPFVSRTSTSQIILMKKIASLLPVQWYSDTGKDKKTLYLHIGINSKNAEFMANWQ